MLRWLTAGESHGPLLIGVLEGLPAGVRITTGEIQAALARRRLGYGRGARMKFELDEVRVTGGLRHGISQGGPFAVQIGNTEWPKWEAVMAADPPAAAITDDPDDKPLDGQGRSVARLGPDHRSILLTPAGVRKPPEPTSGQARENSCANSP